MLIKIVNADGTPAIDAVLMVAQAPVAMPDIGMVADNMGAVHFNPPIIGTYELSIFYQGSEWKEALHIAENSQEHTIVLH
jgi:hypothetical protein